MNGYLFTTLLFVFLVIGKLILIIIFVYFYSIFLISVIFVNLTHWVLSVLILIIIVN